MMMLYLVLVVVVEQKQDDGKSDEATSRANEDQKVEPK
jgi:hypothetical protein